MASTISAGITTTTALSYSADTSGVLQLQTNGGTTALTLDTSQNATFAGKVASASSLQLATNGTTTAVTIDTNQNVGVSVTPSAWSNFKAIEVGKVGNGISTFTSATGAADLYLTSNVYYNGGFKYANTGQTAGAFGIVGNTYQWYIAPSGTAGNAITFTQAMTLNNSGSLVFGVSGQGVSFNNASTPSSGTITGYTISSSGIETTFTDNGTTVTSNSISIPTGVWVISSVTQIIDATGTSNSTAWWVALTPSSTYSISSGTNNSNFQYDHNIQYAQSTGTLQSSSYRGRIINTQVVSNTSGSNVTYYAIAATNGSSSTAVWGIRTQMMAVKVY
jgi:hypothetical protein